MSKSNLCLICHGSCLSSRNSIFIFNSDPKTSSENLISDILTHILEQEITEDSIPSNVICKKCFKNIDEIDELQQRYELLKIDLKKNFEISFQKFSVDTEKNEQLIPNVHKNDENYVKIKKSIFVNTGQMINSAKEAVDKNPLDPIEENLVKMESIGTPSSKILEDEDKNPDFSFEMEINDHENMENSSDSDFNPDSFNSENINKDKNIQYEKKVMNEKPNILKRKIQFDNSNKRDLILNMLPDENESIVVKNQEGTYTCLICEESVFNGSPKSIVQHVKDIHDLRLYICDVCGADFRKRNELSAHLDDHVATEEGDFQCEICNRIFNNLRLFRIHKRMHYPQSKAWSCTICNKKYSSKNLLEEHMNTHTGFRPYICKTCGKDFASKYTFKAHEKTHEIRPRPFQCGQCSKTFLSQQNLAQHERTHLGIKDFSCSVCGKLFGSAHNLEVHSIVHTGYKPFSCNLCGKHFARKAEIKDHERTHTGERPYQCEFCGATFSQRSNLQSHKRATHYDDKRHKCHECGKAFKRRRLLDYHLKAIHTGERPFKCEICEGTFVYPEHFKKHQRIHTGEKPFLCEVCGKAFNSRDNRNAHRFVHSDKKPYECLDCGAGYMRKPQLYQHMHMQGHLNDTIVVNQPRLTTDDDQLVTVNEDGVMEIVDGASVTDESKLYIAEHIIPKEELDPDAGVTQFEHIIIDDQQLSFSENGETLRIVSADYEDIDSEKHFAKNAAENETHIIDTADGKVQLVKVRIPDDNGGEQEADRKSVV